MAIRVFQYRLMYQQCPTPYALLFVIVSIRDRLALFTAVIPYLSTADIGSVTNDSAWWGKPRDSRNWPIIRVKINLT